MKDFWICILPLLLAPAALWAQPTIDFETVGGDFSWKVFGNLEEEVEDETTLWGVVDNPDPSGVNTSSKVMEFTVQDGATVFAGLFTEDIEPITFTDENKIITIAVRKGTISEFDLKWENADGSIAEDLFVSNTMVDEWEILTFDASVLVGQTVTRMIIIPDFLRSPSRESGGVFQFDSITFGSGEATEPENRELTLNGEPLFVRGVCYQPAPIGDDPSASQPFGDYFTSNYSSLWERDLPLLRAMGANAIRVYGWSDTASHDAFLDACYNGGVDPIYVFVNRFIDPNTNWNNAAAVDAVSSTFTAIDSNLGDHPAVAGILLGNEINIQSGNGDDPAFWSAMNAIAGNIKAQTPNRLVSVPITDALGQVEAFDDTLGNIDFWSVQVYRGTSFGTFFNQYAAASDKPVVITEWGIDNYNATANAPYPDNGEFVADTLSSLWLEIEAASGVAAGSCVFEFTDEWWKGAGSPSAQGTGGFAQGGFPDGFSNEEWYGLFAVSQTPGGGPDTLTPRASYFALQSLWLAAEAGTAHIQSMDMRTDSIQVVWESRFGGVYSLEVSGDLLDWRILLENIASAGATTSASVPIESLEGDSLFIRVAASP